MCLAVPSKVIRIGDNTAVIDVDGVTFETSTILLDDVNVGDYVIVHAGFAIQKLDEALAMETLELMREALQSLDE
ncbi:MAG: HypC/HybG/HupF family hydrogenase formation chaperone [Proteobacteria bacterium]|nr:HypC/HybG/HupF family hydrogenase formation chaperone [Pseudomonadota bacterium]